MSDCIFHCLRDDKTSSFSSCIVIGKIIYSLTRSFVGDSTSSVFCSVLTVLCFTRLMHTIRDDAMEKDWWRLNMKQHKNIRNIRKDENEFMKIHVDTGRRRWQQYYSSLMMIAMWWYRSSINRSGWLQIAQITLQLHMKRGVKSMKKRR